MYSALPNDLGKYELNTSLLFGCSELCLRQHILIFYFLNWERVNG